MEELQSPQLTHRIAELEPGVRLHYVVTGSGSRTMVLLHGYPQTWWEWRHVLAPLARAGWRVVAPDYRGAGGSSKPPTGYDKRTMAADIYKLLREHLKIAGPVTMVGHDIGMMVAYAFASEYPKFVEKLVLMEAPLPGTMAYDATVASVNLNHATMRHFFFHNAQNNLAESLTAGRERLYLQHFYERLAFNQDAITDADLDLYASHYSAAGAMRAGFEVYRAFDRDAEDNKAALKKKGRLTMPVLALGGTSSFYLPIAKAMLAEVARKVAVVAIPDAGHWIAEENPQALTQEILKFCSTEQASPKNFRFHKPLHPNSKELPPMPNYLMYQDDLETIAPDENETKQKIVDVMTQGMELARQKYGRSVRVSHAKAHALLKGELIVQEGLPFQLAQGLFAQPGRYQVLIRMAQQPGELLDDSKLSTDRGMSVKVLGVKGPKLAGHTAETQDWVFDVGKQFLASGMKEFLQAFKPNAEIAPKLSDSVKGAVSTVARATNTLLNAVGANSEKLAFYGHPVVHPASGEYYSQVPYRYGEYVAKLGFFPSSPGLQALKEQPFDPETPDALREAMNAFFKQNPAEFELRVQLNTGLEDMPIEDAQAQWPETESQYQTVARLVIPVQTAWDPAKDGYFEDLTFSPAHGLAAHRPLGGINRARLVAYKALADRRLADNGKKAEMPTSTEEVPA